MAVFGPPPLTLCSILTQAIKRYFFSKLFRTYLTLYFVIILVFLVNLLNPVDFIQRCLGL